MASHQCSIFSAYLILLICPVKNGGITKVKAFEGKDIEAMSMLDQVEAYAELVAEVIPDVPKEVINRLSIPQLQQIFSFAMEQAEEENEAAAGEDVK